MLIVEITTTNAVAAFGVDLALFGLLPLAIAGIVWGVRLEESRLHRNARTAVTVTVRELLTATELPQRVIVTGRVRPGPAGLLTAPLAQQPCVWYRTTAYRLDHPDARVHAPELVAIEDGTGAVAVSTRLLDRVLLEETLLSNPWELASVDRRDGLPEMQPLYAAGLPSDSGRTSSRLAERYAPDGHPVTLLASPRHTPHGVILEAGLQDGCTSYSPERVREQALAGLGKTGSTARGLTRLALVPITAGLLIFAAGTLWSALS